MYDGIINVYKEKGFTSHDVVAKMRGILGQRKIGHTGTLDPAAEGVLPVCAGKGTKHSFPTRRSSDLDIQGCSSSGNRDGHGGHDGYGAGDERNIGPH